MVSECTTSAPESTGSGFSARTSTIARRLETTHSGSYVALSSRVAAVVERAGAGVSGRGEGSRREPGWLSVDDRDATRDTGHLRTPRTAGTPGPGGGLHSDLRRRGCASGIAWTHRHGGVPAGLVRYRGADAL